MEHLDIPEAVELRKLRLLKDELGELAAQGAPGLYECLVHFTQFCKLPRSLRAPCLLPAGLTARLPPAVRLPTCPWPAHPVCR